MPRHMARVRGEHASVQSLHLQWLISVCISEPLRAYNRASEVSGTESGDGRPSMKGYVMFTFSIELPESITVAVGDTGLNTVVPVKDIVTANPDMARFAALAGFMGALNNISRGKDANDKALSDDAWSAMRGKKVAVWLGGTWGATGRSDSAIKLAKDQFVFEAMARTNAAASAIEAKMKADVLAAFGKATPATFGAYLDAVALAKYPSDKELSDRAEYRESIESGLMDRARARKAESDVVLDLSDIL